MFKHPRTTGLVHQKVFYTHGTNVILYPVKYTTKPPVLVSASHLMFSTEQRHTLVFTVDVCRSIFTDNFLFSVCRCEWKGEIFAKLSATCPLVPHLSPRLRCCTSHYPLLRPPPLSATTGSNCAKLWFKMSAE